jgi:hypothetical protein
MDSLHKRPTTFAMATEIKREKKGRQRNATAAAAELSFSSNL